MYKEYIRMQAYQSTEGSNLLAFVTDPQIVVQTSKTDCYSFTIIISAP